MSITQTNPNHDSKHSGANLYGYTPSEAWAITFIVLFTVSAAVHCVQAWRARQWVIYPSLVLGALIEVLGWSGRLWSSKNLYLLTPYLMQICTLIMAPVWFSAYCYTALGQAIARLGPEYSVLPPRWYFIVFLTADVVSLVLQAIGGGQAAAAASRAAPTKSATKIMLAGIVFQLASMFIFLVLGADFVFRKLGDRPYAFRTRRVRRASGQSEKALGNVESGSEDHAGAAHADDANERRGWWFFLAAVMISSIMIVLRGFMRSVELGQGWTGYVMKHQIFQNVLDGIPMVIAVAVFNVLNPLWLLPRRPHWRGTGY
ncbi:hypothetical protein Q5752_005839 [Cryptotrichosporon argae]